MNPTALTEEGPTRLVWLFRHSQRSAHRQSDDLLPIACQLLPLATHLPQWRENEGSEGQLSVSLQVAEDGSLELAPRGHAIVRTMIERTVTFPKRP